MSDIEEEIDKLFKEAVTQEQRNEVCTGLFLNAFMRFWMTKSGRDLESDWMK
jgi:hypothetical protein